MTRAERYDVVVVGAGPAGCAAAAIAAQRGLKVLLLERNASPTFKIGESLIPQCYWTLQRMGAIERMRQSPFVKKYSVQFFNKSGIGSTPFYFRDEKDDESAQTWQVLRSEFDQLLFEVAADQGAECRRGVEVREVHFDDGRATGVQARGRDGTETAIEAAVVIDATGQGSLVGTRLGLAREDYGLRNAAIFSHFRGAIRDPGIDEGATLVLLTNDGESWFWYIPLHDDIVSVGVVGPADLLNGQQGTREEVFARQVGRCPEIARRIGAAEQCWPFRLLRDFSYRRQCQVGPGWMLVGDAATFIDPIYSTGVFLALKYGEVAADAAADAIHAGYVSAEALGKPLPDLVRAADVFLVMVRAFYSRDFSFGAFLRRYPEQASAVTRVLIGDVMERDFSGLSAAIAEWSASVAAAGVPDQPARLAQASRG